MYDEENDNENLNLEDMLIGFMIGMCAMLLLETLTKFVL